MASLPQQNPFAALIAALMSPQGGSNYNPMDEANADVRRLQGLRNDPQHDRNMDYAPGLPGPSNPFSNGFFNFGAAQMSPEARMATQGGSAMNQWAQLGGVDGVDPGKLQGLMSHMTPTPHPYQSAESVDQFSDPFARRRLEQMQNPTPRPVPMPPRPTGNGSLEGMVNPGAKNPFADNNFFSVNTNPPPLPSGVVASDGTTNYKRRTAATASANPRPGFNFSGLR